jgi:hypothetical protein
MALLGQLAASRNRGVLEVTNHDGTYKVGFCNGHINAIELPGDDPDTLLGAILVRQGALGKKTVARALDEARRDNRLCGQVLLAAGLSPTVLWNTLKKQARRRFHCFLHYGSGGWRFFSDQSLSPKSALGVPLDPRTELAPLSAMHIEDPNPNAASVTDAPLGRTTRNPAHLPTSIDGHRLPDTRTLKRWWWRMARSCHPDLHPTADQKTRAAMQKRFVQIRKQYLARLAQLENSHPAP